MKTPSSMFRNAKPGTPGRRATRWLNDEAVARAKTKSEDINHQAKFIWPRLQWMKTITALTLACLIAAQPVVASEGTTKKPVVAREYQEQSLIGILIGIAGAGLVIYVVWKLAQNVKPPPAQDNE